MGSYSQPATTAVATLFVILVAARLFGRLQGVVDVEETETVVRHLRQRNEDRVEKVRTKPGFTEVERKEVGERGREMIEFIKELNILLMKSAKGVDR